VGVLERSHYGAGGILEASRVSVKGGLQGLRQQLKPNERGQRRHQNCGVGVGGAQRGQQGADVTGKCSARPQPEGIVGSDAEEHDVGGLRGGLIEVPLDEVARRRSVFTHRSPLNAATAERAELTGEVARQRIELGRSSDAGSRRVPQHEEADRVRTGQRARPRLCGIRETGGVSSKASPLHDKHGGSGDHREPAEAAQCGHRLTVAPPR